MKEKMLMMLVQMVMQYMTADKIKAWVSHGVTALKEDIEQDGKTDWKDYAVLPMLNNIEQAFDLDED